MGGGIPFQGEEEGGGGGVLSTGNKLKPLMQIIERMKRAAHIREHPQSDAP